MKNSGSSPIDQLRTAQPVDREFVSSIAEQSELTDSLTTLRTQISEEPRPNANPARSHARFGSRRLAAGLAIAATAAVVLVGGTLVTDNGSNGSAWAAEDIKFAQSTPQLLFASPRWRVKYVDQYGPGNSSGELEYKIAVLATPKPDVMTFDPVELIASDPNSVFAARPEPATHPAVPLDQTCSRASSVAPPPVVVGALIVSVAVSVPAGTALVSNDKYAW